MIHPSARLEIDSALQLAHLAGQDSFEDFVQDTVYSQLNIKDDGESEMSGKIYDILFTSIAVRLLILVLFI